MRVDFIEPSLNFAAKPANMGAYTKTVNEGLQVLDKKVGIIIHNSSVPSKPLEGTGIGSLLSQNARAAFIPFLKEHAVSTVQQEPAYCRRLSDPSPYSPISTSKNIYMIPLEILASEEYDNLLSKETLGKIQIDSINNSEKVDYAKVNANYDIALREVYDNYQTRTKNGELSSLAQEYSKFKQQNLKTLEPNAIYEILVKKYNEEEWQNWDEIDRNLYDNPENTTYLNQLKEDYKSEIDYHIFKQFLVEREIEKTNKLNEAQGLRIIADTPVAFTPSEVWQNKDLFMDDYALGCPPDFFSREGQRWEFAVLKPELIFNKDGSLGKAGKFLQKRYEDIFKDCPGGVRIDHVIGLVDPFVYNKKESHMTFENSGRLYSSPHNKNFESYAKYSIEEYAALLEKIVFPAALKYGISKDSIICEDLGEVTSPTRAVLNKLGLPCISVTQFGANGYDAPENNVIMPGSHDNKSYIEYTNDFFANANNSEGCYNYFMHKTHTLASDTSIPGQDENMYREKLRNNKKNFLSASFAELFTSPAKKIQLFFTDFFGIGKTYNVPGTKKDCWTLRLNENFEKLYYDNLAEGLGVNFPEAIARAIRHRGEEFSQKYQDLLKRLDEFTQILKN